LSRNCILEHIIEGKIEGRERGGKNLSYYWMTSKKRHYILTPKKKL
jgi:hypothetical protein